MKDKIKYKKMNELVQEFIEDVKELGFEVYGDKQDGSMVIEIYEEE